MCHVYQHDYLQARNIISFCNRITSHLTSQLHLVLVFWLFAPNLFQIDVDSVKPGAGPMIDSVSVQVYKLYLQLMNYLHVVSISVA